MLSDSTGNLANGGRTVWKYLAGTEMKVVRKIWQFLMVGRSIVSKAASAVGCNDYRYSVGVLRGGRV
jgi:hypothetical protein